MPRVLDAAALRAWCTAGRAALAGARSEIDELNVFPVPDGDTGTNLLLTVESVEGAVLAAGPDADVRAVVRAMAHGALLGARGNSGVLLSQLLRGVAESLGAAAQADAAALAAGLVAGAQQARAAVSEPAEGTLLSVATAAAAAAAADAAAGQGLEHVVRAAREAGEAALARTPDQLPVLRRAGVVDAGGRGWVVLLRELEAVVTGRECGAAASGPPLRRGRDAVEAARGAARPAHAYEVQYLLAGADEAAAARLRTVLGGLGDCVLVVGGGEQSAGTYNVHAHVDDVGAAIEAGLAAGRPSRITVSRFQDAAPPPGRAVVAVCGGDGLARLYAAAGARVVRAGRGARPPVADLLDAVLATGADEVVLLPDDDALRGTARAVAEQARAHGVVVRVVPTGSAVQGLAALAVADAGRRLDEDVAAMTAAAAATRTGAVVRAVTSASTSAGLCLPGDALGLLDGAVAVVGAEVPWVARRVLDRLLPGTDLLTLVVGADAPLGLGEALAAHARRGAPEVEVVLVDGGSAAHVLLVGAE